MMLGLLVIGLATGLLWLGLQAAFLFFATKRENR